MANGAASRETLWRLTLEATLDEAGEEAERLVAVKAVEEAVKVVGGSCGKEAGGDEEEPWGQQALSPNLY